MSKPIPQGAVFVYREMNLLTKRLERMIWKDPAIKLKRKSFTPMKLVFIATENNQEDFFKFIEEWQRNDTNQMLNLKKGHILDPDRVTEGSQ